MNSLKNVISLSVQGRFFGSGYSVLVLYVFTRILVPVSAIIYQLKI